MFNDEVIQQWITEKGKATSFTFIVYGQLKEEECTTLVRGLTFFLEVNQEIIEMVAFLDKIDEKQAVAWNTFQGTSLSLVFAGDKLYLEEQITEVIQDGLDYLKYKNDYLGSKISDSHV